MQTYEILVQNRAVRGNSKDMTLVRTSVGIDVMHVLFDSEEWLGFPVTVTFAQGDDVITVPLLLSTVDSAEWVAESECVIPHEVIDAVGPIRVTFQGTDSDGNHIITAKGSPLSVEESGDEIVGNLPSEVPTLDQWNQAYAKAMEAANAAQSLVSNLQTQIDSIVSSAESEIAAMIGISPATRESLGVVKIGNGVMIAEDGTISVLSGGDMTQEQATALVNLSRLAYACFDTEFDESGLLTGNPTVKSSQLPMASLDNAGVVIPDGTTITIDSDGMIHAPFITHEWNGTTLTITSQSGTSSADLHGEQGAKGEVGPQGEQGVQGVQGEKGDPGEITDVTATVSDTVGTPSVEVVLGGTPSERTIAFSFQNLKGEKGDIGPSGYVLTAEDVETISTAIADMYDLAENERF